MQREGDEDLLREKWQSVIFHVQNIHTFPENSKFKKCDHAPISKEAERHKKWLNPTSDAFIALQSIVFNKNLLKDMKHLTRFSHTGVLEVYHSLYNKWVPKSTHFSYSGMVARSQLAALDFNSGSDLPQAQTVNGNPRYNVNYSKITKTWSAKPIKKKKDYNFLHEMITDTLKCVTENQSLPVPELPELPNNIAPVQPLSKKDVISKQQSQFT